MRQTRSPSPASPRDSVISFARSALHRQHVGTLGLCRLGSQLDERHRRVQLHVAPAKLLQFIPTQTRCQDDPVRERVPRLHHAQEGDQFILVKRPPLPRSCPTVSICATSATGLSACACASSPTGRSTAAFRDSDSASAPHRHDVACPAFFACPTVAVAVSRQRMNASALMSASVRPTAFLHQPRHARLAQPDVHVIPPKLAQLADPIGDMLGQRPASVRLVHDPPCPLRRGPWPAPSCAELLGRGLVGVALYDLALPLWTYWIVQNRDSAHLRPACVLCALPPPGIHPTATLEYACHYSPSFALLRRLVCHDPQPKKLAQPIDRIQSQPTACCRRCRP